jgi:hypothetical protein
MRVNDACPQISHGSSLAFKAVSLPAVRGGRMARVRAGQKTG